MRLRGSDVFLPPLEAQNTIFILITWFEEAEESE